MKETPVMIISALWKNTVLTHLPVFERLGYLSSHKEWFLVQFSKVQFIPDRIATLENEARVGIKLKMTNETKPDTVQ